MIDEVLQVRLREKFNPDGSKLRNQQLLLVDMLKVVDTLCRKHNIKYWLDSGNLLGHVRHQGFIPWDDDMDIAMLRKDYKKFVKIAKKELEQYGLALQDNSTDKYYFGPYAKVRHLKSEIREIPGQDKYYKYKGCYIDVFPIERTHLKLAYFAGKCQDKVIFDLTKRVPSRYMPFVRLIHIGLNKALFPIFRLMSFTPSSKYRICYGSGFLEIRTLDYVMPLNREVFEGVECYVPKDADNALKEIYGDYMTLPELNKIHTHLSSLELF